MAWWDCQTPCRSLLNPTAHCEHFSTATKTSHMEGGMQRHPLLVTNILDHAARWNGEQVPHCCV